MSVSIAQITRRIGGFRHGFSDRDAKMTDPKDRVEPPSSGVANFAALTPIAFLTRAAQVFPDAPAVIYNDLQRNWRETEARATALARGLTALGVQPGDVVSVVAPNIPELYECHFGVPMCGAVLNTINNTLDPETMAYILDHSQTRALIVDPQFTPVVQQALALCPREIALVVDIEDPYYEAASPMGTMTYDDVLNAGADGMQPEYIGDELTPISINYTSGTTGNPKGCVYSHRGAYLNAMAHLVDWQMPRHSVYLWTLPMFHCNGWCFPWTIAANFGVNICLRQNDEQTICEALQAKGVTHFCGSPALLVALLNCAHRPTRLEEPVHAMVAGAPPPAEIIRQVEQLNISVTHVYGLTEVYGPAMINLWHTDWDRLPKNERAGLKARQGVGNIATRRVGIFKTDGVTPTPSDGRSIGQVMLQGNNVMLGYLNNEAANRASFQNGWFATGDLGVCHPDGYVEIKDRETDVISVKGQYLSSIEIEGVLYRHPDVLEAAVVSCPDPEWGEIPCGFVTLKPGSRTPAKSIEGFYKEQRSEVEIPIRVVFGDIPKTATGKVLKYRLRARAKKL